MAWFILLWVYARGRGGQGIPLPSDLRGSHLSAAVVRKQVGALTKANYLIAEASVSDKRQTSYRLDPDVQTEIYHCLRAELAGLTEICSVIPRQPD